MATTAVREVAVCSTLLRQCCSHWKSFPQINGLNSASVISGVRFFRGSNRDKRRRERNLRLKLKEREGIQPLVFDKKEFFRKNFERELFAFKNRLGLNFQDDNTLRTALTHESYKHDSKKEPAHTLENNGKLSLIGVTASSLYIVDHLCNTYPSLPCIGVRAQLKILRVKVSKETVVLFRCLHDFLMSRNTIVKLSKLITLPDLIRLEHDLDELSKEKHLDYRPEDVICDAFFAFIGAIYIDQGPVEARRFVDDFVITQLQGEELHKILHFPSAEIVLTNIFITSRREKPIARVIQESGVKTDFPIYVVGVFSGERMISEASSYNVLTAKHEAWKAALMKYCQEGMLMPFPNERKNVQNVSC